MTNTSQGRFIHLSRFLIAFGVLVLSALLFNLIGSGVLRAVYGINAEFLIGKKAADFSSTEQIALKLLQVITAFSFIFAAFITTKVYRENFTDFTHLKFKPKPAHLLLALGVFVTMIPLVNVMLVTNAKLDLPENVAQVFKSAEFRSDNIYQAILDLNTGVYLFFNLFLIALIPAIGEELIFRGILLRIFTSWKKNIHWGVGLSSLLFALLHFQPYKFIPMLFIAISLGYIYYFSGSLWVSILVHFVNNAVVVISDYMIKTGVESVYLQDDYNFPLYVTVLALALFAGLFFLMYKKQNIHVFD